MLTAYLEEKAVNPSKAQLAALTQSDEIPRKVAEAIKTWDDEANTIPPEGIAKLEATLQLPEPGLSEADTEALSDGDLRPLLWKLDKADLYPDDTDLAALQASPELPDRIAEELSVWRDGQTSPKAKAALEKLASQPVPKAVLDAVEAGQLDRLPLWLEEVEVEPEKAEIEALSSAVSPEMLASLRAWNEEDKLGESALDELGGMLGLKPGQTIPEVAVDVVFQS